MGNVYRVVFQTTRDKNDTKKSSLILKVAPQNQFRRQQLNVRSLFLREISMYDKVSKKFPKCGIKDFLYSISCDLKLLMFYIRCYHILMNFNCQRASI